MQQRARSLVLTRPETGARALILLGAFVSFVLSVTLWFGGNEEQGIFVGLWVPSILSLGALVLQRGGAMSPAGIFAMGVLVTLIFGAGLSPSCTGQSSTVAMRLSARPPRQRRRSTGPGRGVPPRLGRARGPVRRPTRRSRNDRVVRGSGAPPRP